MCLGDLRQRGTRYFMCSSGLFRVEAAGDPEIDDSFNEMCRELVRTLSIIVLISLGVRARMVSGGCPGWNRTHEIWYVPSFLLPFSLVGVLRLYWDVHSARTDEMRSVSLTRVLISGVIGSGETLRADRNGLMNIEGVCSSESQPTLMKNAVACCTESVWSLR